jgi:hypothetical protein
MTVQQGPVRFCSVSQVTATRGKNDPEVGAVFTEGDETYRYVYNAGNSQISVGECATVSGVTGYSVTVSTTTMVDYVVGVVKHATLTTGTYGFLLVHGYGPAKMVANSGCAAGQLLTVGGDGKLAVKSISTDAPAAAFAKVVLATGSAGVGEAYYRLHN